jgi:hypothetical protein
MTLSYGVEQLDTDEGPALYLVKRVNTGHDLEDHDEVLEMEVVDELMSLRATDIDGYEVVCIMLTALLERGAPMDSAEA